MCGVHLELHHSNVTSVDIAVTSVLRLSITGLGAVITSHLIIRVCLDVHHVLLDRCQCGFLLGHVGRTTLCPPVGSNLAPMRTCSGILFGDLAQEDLELLCVLEHPLGPKHLLHCLWRIAEVVRQGAATPCTPSKVASDNCIHCLYGIESKSSESQPPVKCPSHVEWSCAKHLDDRRCHEHWPKSEVTGLRPGHSVGMET
mmetsp:Transcript_17183/g.40997  ORF Transcript_17183/g.40997 Transcript_17183/m.40997 type:complete len:200 (+) Transcript_17183:236-835(+)